jgi:hypothetical protein
VKGASDAKEGAWEVKEVAKEVKEFANWLHEGIREVKEKKRARRGPERS